MALQFDPSPYLQVWRQQQADRQPPPDLNATVNQPLLQGLNMLSENRRQEQLLDMAKQREGREASEFAYRYGKPINENIEIASDSPTMGRSSFMPSGQGNVSGGMRLVDAFNAWRAGGMKGPARPEFLPALGQEERKQFYDAQNPKPQPNYVIPEYDVSGNVTGMTPLPAGTKPAPAARPGQNYVVPQYDANGNVLGFTPLPAGTKPAPAARPIVGKGKISSPEAQGAFNLYETARDGLLSGLESSVTGPIVGKLPAFTSEQQTAEGAVAAMAPVLKQLFRVAGEGVFTDRDQQLLLDMIPTRKTRPEARKNQIENIDRIVKAKLGMANNAFASNDSSSTNNDPLGIR